MAVSQPLLRRGGRMLTIISSFNRAWKLRLALSAWRYNALFSCLPARALVDAAHKRGGFSIVENVTRRP